MFSRFENLASSRSLEDVLAKYLKCLCEKHCLIAAGKWIIGEFKDKLVPFASSIWFSQLLVIKTLCNRQFWNCLRPPIIRWSIIDEGTSKSIWIEISVSLSFNPFALDGAVVLYKDRVIANNFTRKGKDIRKVLLQNKFHYFFKRPPKVSLIDSNGFSKWA